MKVLVVNTGSSSIKYELFEMDNRQVISKGIVERIGDSGSSISHTICHESGDQKIKQEFEIQNHEEGLKNVVALLTDSKVGVIQNADEIDAVGHRVVHGGESYSGAAKIDDSLKAKVRELIPLAPLHNPPNLTGIEVSERFFPNAIQVAVFDTAFHQTMPPVSYRFAIPNHFYEKEKIRAYGFHGTSHAYVSNQMLKELGNPEDSAIITIHLGNGCSMAAIRNGKCLDTTMGISPLGGLMMGTRSGDIDPAMPFFMNTKLGMSMEEIDKVLNKESGLKGITGSNDMRDVLEKRATGDANAMLAIDMYVHKIKKYIGAYAAEMGKLDAVVFTAGIGENSDIIRSLTCRNLGLLGIQLDEHKNNLREKGIRKISTEGSPTQVWIIPTNEELQIAIRVEELIGN